MDGSIKKNRLIIFGSLLLFFVSSIDCDCNLRTNYLCDDQKTCVPKKYVCNGYPDCPGSDDERNCDVQKCDNKEKFFLCRDKKTCIAKVLTCDMEADCPDASDESDEMCDSLASVSIGSAPNKTCDPLTQFTCGNGVCVPLEDVCNGAKNCIDGSDESPTMCTNYTDKYKCPGYLCANGKCLEMHDFVCDGIDDCGDGSDEEHCHAECSLSNGKYLCASGDQCIDIKNVCDNKNDCEDKSDEGDYCKKIGGSEDECKTFNCPKTSECKVLPSGPTCICKNGYAMNSKTNVCEDVNECEVFGTCSQGCVNQEGSYYCTCAKGFILDDDKKTCETISSNVSLIYTTKKYIKKLTLGQQITLFHAPIAKTRQSVGVTFDGESYYWTEVDMAREVIVKYNPEKDTKEILLTNGLELPEYIAVDWLTKNIYFTDSTRRHVAVCTNDGYYCTELVKIDIMHYPRSIALLPQEGLLFWTDWGNNSHIGVSFMDGSNPKVLVDDVQWPNGLALDWPNRRIYWIDALTNSIETVKITGEDRRVVLKGVFKHPFSMDVFGNRLYWSDHETKTIEYCDKFTGKNHDVLVQGSEIFDVHIYDQSAMPYTKHGCEGNPCSHICLLKGEGDYSCVCPIGMELSSDQHNCRFNSKSFIIHVGVGNNLYSKIFQSFGRSIENTVKHTDVKIHKMEYNILNGAIFYANNVEHKLYVLDTIGNSHLLMEGPNLHITSMSFDYLGNNLYWSDNIKETIEVLSLKTKKHAIVHHYTGEFIPSSIVVVPSMGEIFVALVSQRKSQISRVSMKGSDMDDTDFRVIRDGLGNGNIYLTVDETEKKLYWSDSEKKRIEFSNFDGTNRRIFIMSERTPGPLTLVDDYLHWTSVGSKSMQWRRKNATGPLKLTKIDTLLETKKSDFPKILPITTGNPIKTNNHPCAVENGGCSDICISDGPNSKVCLCSLGRIFIDNAQTKCENRTLCDARCASGECLKSSMLCDGKIDCPDRSDEDDTRCKQRKCKMGEFKCDNGECISKLLRCDKHDNCKDGSDEKNCPKEGSIDTCKPNQWQCKKSMECIFRTKVCDMVADCLDYSDELDESCNQKCLDSEFKCLSGQCIPKEFKCNHKIDCFDGSDEDDDCAQMCEPPFKPCRDGHCIHERFFCDGVNDCADNFDEINCPENSTALVECGKNMFQCPSKPELCLESYKKCDKNSDCPKGEDERDCPRCLPYEFTCSNGICINGNLKCDGKPDCKDYSDEADCDDSKPPEATCTASMYKCSNGKCLDYGKVCDGIPDCDDDEGGQCSEACVGNRCSQKCLKTPKGALCVCQRGFELKSGSDSQCIDIDECDTLTSSPCSQVCVNTEGSYKCSCYDGFVPAGNGFECRATGDSFKLIYALGSEIRQIYQERKDFLFQAESPISSMVVDVRKNILIYSLIGDSNLYVMNLKDKTSSSVDNFPMAILLAYDWLTENIYMTTRNSFNIMEINACSMVTKKCVKIHSLPRSRYHITSMDIDPINKYLFIVRRYTPTQTRSTAEIISMRLDGSDEQTIFKDAYLSDVRALSVDAQSRTIYFTEQKTQSLMRIDYKGDNKATYVHQSARLLQPLALETYENHAFVLDTAHGKISICKLYQDNECFFEIPVQSAKRFVVAQISKQADGTNSCAGNKCSEICINADRDKKCLCNGLKGEAVSCLELKEHVNSSDDHKTSSIFWIILLIFLFFVVIGGAGFLYYKRRGLAYKLNIGFNKNRGTMRINEFTPNNLQSVDAQDKAHFVEMSKNVTFSTLKSPDYTEIASNNLNVHNPEHVNAQFNQLVDFGDGSDSSSGEDNNDDDHQLLIK